MEGPDDNRKRARKTAKNKKESSANSSTDIRSIREQTYPNLPKTSPTDIYMKAFDIHT